MIAQLLHEVLAARAGVVLIDGERALSGVELDALARRWAATLAGRRRVGLIAENGAELAAAFIGALYAGAAVVPLHAGAPAAEIDERVRRFAVEVVVRDGVLIDTLGRASSAPTPVETIATPVETIATPVETIATPVETIAPVAPDETALLLGTSGTTGEPRAVVIPHGGLAVHTLALVGMLGLGPDDRVLATLPLAHSYGCRMALLVPLLSGATVILVQRFSAHATLASMHAHAITWAPVVPTMLSAWAAVPGAAPTGLRWLLSAGAPLPRELRLRAEARLGCVIREGYGLTEASFCTVDAPPHAPAPGTVGRPVPGVGVRIDPLSREVQVRGPNLMSGYDDEPGTRAAFADGWLRTGDVGALDAEGRLTIVDRIKDVILRGGHTIHPAEVEAALVAHPAIAAAAVVGRPHPHLGEEVVAFVVPGRDADPPTPCELTEWSAARLAPYKVPVEVIFATELPLGPSGKVLKRRLRGLFGLPDLQ